MNGRSNNFFRCYKHYGPVSVANCSLALIFNDGIMKHHEDQ